MKSPVEFRVGSTGAGVFVGCGAGLGIVTPISLHSVPVLGQVIASLASSLGSLNHATGGLASTARSRVRALGVRNLDLGFGCGVLVGYGYGAGLMLHPSALQSLSQAVQAAGQQLMARLPPPLQAALQPRQGQQQGAHGAVGLLPGLGGPGPGPVQSGPAALDSWQGPAAQLPGLQSPPPQPIAAPEGAAGSMASTGVPRQQHQQQRQQQGDELAELSKLVLKQQNQLSDLHQQVASLQAAVCKLDSSAPGCQHPRPQG